MEAVLEWIFTFVKFYTGKPLIKDLFIGLRNVINKLKFSIRQPEYATVIATQTS